MRRHLPANDDSTFLKQEAAGDKSGDIGCPQNMPLERVHLCLAASSSRNGGFATPGLVRGECQGEARVRLK